MSILKSKWSIVIMFVAIFGVIQLYELDRYFTFENLQAQRDILKTYVEHNAFFTLLLFIIIYIVSVTFMIPIATVLTLSGGFLFGAIWGTLVVNIAATIGATLAFLFARYIIGEKIQTQYEKQLHTFNKELESNKYQYLFSLRFLPIFPFFLVNFLSGVTRVDLKSFIITTSIGIIPGSFVYTYAGSQLAHIDSIGDIFTKEILMAFILLGLLTLLPVIIKKINARKSAKR